MVKRLKIPKRKQKRKSNKDRQHNGQKFEDTKELNRSRKSNKDRQHNGLKFEDTKELNRSRKSNKNRQHNGQKFEDTKELSRSVNQTRIDNTMAKSLKIPKRKQKP